MLSPEGVLVLCAAVWIITAALLLTAFEIYRRRRRLSLVHALLYFIDILLVRVLWRTRIEGEFPLPIGTGGIVVCNHRSSIDPFFIQVLIPKAMHWLVAAEYFKAPGMGWFLRQTGAIPVKRGAVDTSATKLAIRRAQQGDVVGIFPEARINTTGELLLPGRVGVALIALRAGVPVVPCYIEGSPYDGKSVLSPFFMRAKVTVHIGKPIDLSEYQNRKGQGLHEELTLRFLREIARLAGRPDYQPTLAHRGRTSVGNDAEQTPEPSCRVRPAAS